MITLLWDLHSHTSYEVSDVSYTGEMTAIYREGTIDTTPLAFEGEVCSVFLYLSLWLVFLFSHCSAVKTLYWNVNGIGNKFDNKLLIKYMTEYDIIVLAETQKGTSYELNIEGYQSEHFPSSNRHNRAKRTPGGFLVFVKESICKNIKLCKENDFLIWVYVRSSLMKTPNDVAIGFVYIPPEGSPHIPYDVEPFEMLQNAIMCKFKQHVVYICGDTNARTGTYDDYICMDRFEDEVAGLTSSYDTTTRNYIDPKLNTYGRKVLSLCKQTGVQIQNRRLSESKYTCFRPNGASSVDYLLTTLEKSKYLASFNVLDHDIYSDHCPLSFCFHANKGIIWEENQSISQNSYKWDPKYRDIYRKRVTYPAAKSMRNNFLCDIVTQEITPNEVMKKFKA